MLVDIQEPTWIDSEEGAEVVWHSPTGTFRIDKATKVCFKDHQFRYCRDCKPDTLEEMKRIIFEQYLFEIDATPIDKDKLCG